MIRFLVILVLLGMFVWFGATVNLGKRTFFGHISAVWSTPEAKDMTQDIKDKAGPAAKKLKRGVEAGVREVTRDDVDAGTAGRPAPR